MPNYPKDLTGQTFGRLTVLSRMGKTRHHNSLWLCLCECGEYKDNVLYGSLKSGRTKACGACLKPGPAKGSRKKPTETEEDWI